ncbi:MAG: glycosyltransferase family 2 protein [Planctomycetota bacterium]
MQHDERHSYPDLGAVAAMDGVNPYESGTATELLVVMPVYNEEASVRKVVLEWFQEIQCWTENFIFLAIDDGSKDGTSAVLERLREQLGTRLQVISRHNRGHGQSCLEGYLHGCAVGIPWILQIDSDGQCDPAYFYRFWRCRERYQVIYGYRWWRSDGLRRVVASTVLRLTVLAFARALCPDANVPYRLLRTNGLAPIVAAIPRDFFLANVALAILLRRHRWSEHFVPIRFRDRYAGTPSVKLTKFGGKAQELIRQIAALPASIPRGPTARHDDRQS